jgi:hypothetical protein
MGIDVRMLLDKTEEILLIPLEDFCDSGIGLFRPNLSLAEITIDGLPIPRGESIEKVIAHIPDTDRSIKVAQD